MNDRPTNARAFRACASALVNKSSLATELWLLARGTKSWHQLVRNISWLGHRLINETIITETALGKFSVSTKDSVIARNLFCNKDFEFGLIQEVKSLIGELVRPAAVENAWMLDIGANIGVTAIPALLSGLVANTISCEPDPLNYRLLVYNARINGLAERITTFNLALSNISGVGELELSQINFGDHRLRVPNPLTPARVSEERRQTETTRVSTVDELISEVERTRQVALQLAWIDTQGHEVQVLEGGNQVFGRGLPTVIEIWPYGVRRAGKTKDDLCHLLAAFWRTFHLLGGLDHNPRMTQELPTLWDSLEELDSHCNILLLR